MNISAASDYAIRASLYLASAYMEDQSQLKTTEQISIAEKIPLKYLEALIRKLKVAKLISSQRGANGGHKLNMPPSQISIADIIRAIDGPLAAVKGERPESLKYSSNADGLKEVWIAVRASLRSVLENVYLDQIVKDNLPKVVKTNISQPGAWSRRV